MDCVVSNDLGYYASRAGSGEPDFRDSVSGIGNSSFLPHDVDPADRAHSASPPVEKVRKVQVLAQFLAPIAPSDPDRLAARIIDRFGSLGAAMRIDGQTFVAHCALDKAIFQLVMSCRGMVKAAMSEDIRSSKISVLNEQMQQYLRFDVGSCRDEKVLAIFCDIQGRYLKFECLNEGQRQSVAFPLKALICRAIDLDARRIVLVHNHPSGSCKPSANDVEVTKNVEKLLRPLEIALVDHLIVTRASIFSMRKGAVL